MARLLGTDRVEAIRAAARGAGGDVVAVRRRLPFPAALAEIRLALTRPDGSTGRTASAGYHWQSRRPHIARDMPHVAAPPMRTRRCAAVEVFREKPGRG